MGEYDENCDAIISDQPSLNKEEIICRRSKNIELYY